MMDELFFNTWPIKLNVVSEHYGTFIFINFTVSHAELTTSPKKKKVTINGVVQIAGCVAGDVYLVL